MSAPPPPPPPTGPPGGNSTNQQQQQQQQPSSSRTTSPIPPTTTTTTAAAAATEEEKDWRKSVPQSYRSSEVRAVASVLASLEPSTTTSSKLMLAMRFEEAIFQSASSLTDYRKRLKKRLKKVQKSYNPSSSSAEEKDNNKKAALEEEEEKAKKAEETKERELRETFGEKLLFITTHASEAVKIMKEKHGRDRANLLKQHTDNAEQWAVEIGLPLPPSSSSSVKRRKRIPRDSNYLEKLTTHLDQRVDNIRSHVVKLTAPDLFIGETLIKLEEDMEGKTATILSSATLDALLSFSASSSSGTGTGGGGNAVYNVQNTKQLLEKAMSSVPTPPPKTRRTFSLYHKATRESAIQHVQKIKYAANVMISYMALQEEEDEENCNSGMTKKLEVKGCLKQSHDVAVESLKHLEVLCGKLEEELEEEGVVVGNSSGGGEKKMKEKMVTLEDAWNKVMEYKSPDAPPPPPPPPSSSATTAVDLTMEEAAEPDSKRLKTTTHTTTPSNHNYHQYPKVVIKSQVLLTPGRKPPTSLISALKMKQAELILSNSVSSSSGSSGGSNKGGMNGVRMKFGGTKNGTNDDNNAHDDAAAFEMIIYLVPLLVIIRALPPSNNNNNKKRKLGGVSSFRKTIANGGLSTYIPPTRYLHLQKKRKRSATTTSSSTTTTTSHNLLPLSVLGINGTSSTLSPFISQKLNYASMHATYVLRKIFAQLAGKCYVDTANTTTTTTTTTGGSSSSSSTNKRLSDFEIEISEATALLQFLQLARETYMPDGGGGFEDGS